MSIDIDVVKPHKPEAIPKGSLITNVVIPTTISLTKALRNPATGVTLRHIRGTMNIGNNAAVPAVAIASIFKNIPGLV